MCSKKRIVLTLEDRVRVIRENENGISQRKLTEIFNCSKTQINSILRSKDNILKDWHSNMNRDVKRKRHEKFADVNAFMIEWFKSAKWKNMPISGPVIKEKAFEIATRLGITDFTASNGWLERFRVRHNIAFRSMCGGDAGDDVNYETYIDWYQHRLPSLVEGYARRDIFHMDETGLFYRALPSNVKRPPPTDGNISRERLTIALCVNGEGEKEPPLVIGSSKSLCSRYLKHQHEWTTLNGGGGTTWLVANKNAWMTREIFERWLLEFNRKMAMQKRQVLLFLDNAPCHMYQSELENVKLCFMPPPMPSMMTTKLLPLGQGGIIDAFKMSYRKRVLLSIIARMDEFSNAFEFSKKITVNDAIPWINSSWEDIPATTIVKGFALCGFLKATWQEFMPEEDAAGSLDVLAKVARIDYDPTAAVQNDENLDCYDDLSGDWEERAVREFLEKKFIADPIDIKDTDGDSDEEDVAIENVNCSMPLQEVLLNLDIIHRSADLKNYDDREHIDQLFFMLKDSLEREIVKKKCAQLTREKAKTVGNFAKIFI